MTGKDLKVAQPLTGQPLADALAGGRLIYNEELRKTLPEADLFKLLSNELTPVRMIAARMLQERNLNRVDKLIPLLDSDNRYARYGACNGMSLAGFKSPKAVEALCKKIEKDEDILFRYFAVDALPNYGQDAKPVVDVIETWPILKGRGATDLVKKLPELKKKVESSQKLQLKSIKG